MTVPAMKVVGEHVAGRGVQRHQPRLAELGAADGQHPGLEIQIAQLEVTRLAEAQPRDTQEPEQTVVEYR